MPTPFAINGLGRIGRALLRIALDRPELRLVAVNDLADADRLARLIAHDTLHGRFPGEVAIDNLLGAAAARQGNADEARRHWTRSLTRQPRQPRIRELLEDLESGDR